MKVAAVIPARGGSKGIIDKNLVSVGGLPLIRRAVLAASSSQLVDRIYVSTDDDRIGRAATEAGALVIRRPGPLAGDTASSESALEHAIGEMSNQDGYKPDIVAFIQCTAPLLDTSEIDGTIQLVIDGADTAFAAVPTHGFLWDASGTEATPINHERNFRVRRQDLGHQVVEAGSVYAMRTAGFLESGSRFFGRTVAHVMAGKQHLEIDHPLDLVIAEAVLSTLDRRSLPKPVGALVMDFDGVLTDNRVWITEDGQESVVASRSDGMGLSELRRRGLPMLVLSKERNPVVAARCRKLDLPFLQGVDDKATRLAAWCDTKLLRLESVVYVGNDVNDIECMKMVGCGVTVGDAHWKVRAVADIRLSAAGGRGAIRELADLISERG